VSSPSCRSLLDLRSGIYSLSFMRISPPHQCSSACFYRLCSLVLLYFRTYSISHLCQNTVLQSAISNMPCNQCCMIHSKSHGAFSLKRQRTGRYIAPEVLIRLPQSVLGGPLRILGGCAAEMSVQSQYCGVQLRQDCQNRTSSITQKGSLQYPTGQIGTLSPKRAAFQP